eukprot:1932847-Amphidinium_carterae.1
MLAWFEAVASSGYCAGCLLGDDVLAPLHPFSLSLFAQMFLDPTAKGEHLGKSVQKYNSKESLLDN